MITRVNYKHRRHLEKIPSSLALFLWKLGPTLKLVVNTVTPGRCTHYGGLGSIVGNSYLIG